MGIKHRADTGFRKFSDLNQVHFGWTVKYFKMPYVSYPRLVRNSAFLQLYIFSSSAARTTRAYSARNSVLTIP